MKHTIVFVLGSVILMVVSGCGSGGVFIAGNSTEVQLQRGNFKIIARGVAGESSAGYLIGIGASSGMSTGVIALVRVSGSGMMYTEAMDALWKNYETQHGPIEGKKLALINVRYDADILNLLVYVQPKVMIRADVVEFTD